MVYEIKKIRKFEYVVFYIIKKNKFKLYLRNFQNIISNFRKKLKIVIRNFPEIVIFVKKLILILTKIFKICFNI